MAGVYEIVVSRVLLYAFGPLGTRHLLLVVLTLVVAALAVGYALLTPLQKARLRATLAGARLELVFVAAASAPLLAAVTLPGVPGWLRWVLVVVAVGVMLASRLWKVAAWPDVAAVSLVAISVIALVGLALEEQEDEPSKPTVGVVLPKAKVVVLESVEADADAVVIVVEASKAADDVPITYAPARHSGTTRSYLEEGKQGDDVVIDVERGEAEVAAGAMLADVVGAKRIYVMPAAG